MKDVWSELQELIHKKLKERLPQLNKHWRRRYAKKIVQNLINLKVPRDPVALKNRAKKLQKELNELEYANLSRDEKEAKKEELEVGVILWTVAAEALHEFYNQRKIKIEKREESEKEVEVSIEEIQEEIQGVIGRISISVYTPSTPSEFHIWIKDDEEIHLEPGMLLSVDCSEGKKIVGIVEDVKATSDIPSPVSEFYSTGYGNPEESISIERPVIREGKLRVVFRNDNRVEPVIRKYPVRYATRGEIINAYSGNIPDERRILVGFTRDEKLRPVPVYADYEYMFGFRGAHVNISGASGLAAKTSYSLFLILSALAYSDKNPGPGLGVIAFNVKDVDLLNINIFKENFDNFEDAIKHLREEIEDLENAYLWQEAKKEGINPFEIFSEENIKILRPSESIYFGFRDLVQLGNETPEILRMMFNPEDLDDNFEAILNGIVEEYFHKEKNYSFKDIEAALQSKLDTKTQRDVSIGGIPIHKATLSKFLRRLDVSLRELHKIIDRRNPITSNVLNIHTLSPGEIYIIDIEPLPDRGKRLVFLSVLRLISKILEAKKENEKYVNKLIGMDDISIENFPNRIAVFVDELNKFAPRGKEFSMIKMPIIDIAARGRSLGLSLIGAQQLASQIDSEILSNCSTFAVGRSHPLELSERSYAWVHGALKDRIAFLRPGQILMFHAIHNAPVLLQFPIPLHHLRR